MRSVCRPMRRIHPNKIHKSQNHLSTHSFEEWKEQIEYSYFEEEMPDRLPLVEMLLGIFSRLEQKPDCQALTRSIDSCTVLELLEEMREVDWKEIRVPSAYLEKKVREHLLRREALLAALWAGTRASEGCGGGIPRPGDSPPHRGKQPGARS